MIERVIAKFHGGPLDGTEVELVGDVPLEYTDPSGSGSDYALGKYVLNYMDDKKRVAHYYLPNTYPPGRVG